MLSEKGRNEGWRRRRRKGEGVIGIRRVMMRSELRQDAEGRTIATGDLLIIERLFQLHSEGLRPAVAATVPCLRHRRCLLRLGFRGHLGVEEGGTVETVF
jgi:hypothetical protein